MQTQDFQLQFRQQDFKIFFNYFIFFLIFILLRETWHNMAKCPQLFWKKEGGFISLLQEMFMGELFQWFYYCKDFTCYINFYNVFIV